MPMQVIVAINPAIGANDKTKLKNFVNNHYGETLADAKYHFGLYRKGTKERLVTFFWKQQLDKNGNMTQAKLDALLDRLDTSSDVTVVLSRTPSKDMADASWFPVMEE